MKSGRKTVLVLCLLAVGFGRIVAVGAAETPLSQTEDTASLELVEVDLYTGGIGLFAFRGDVERGEEVNLRLPGAYVPDVLKSLVVRGRDGTVVPVLSYESTDQLERRLQGEYLDLSGNPDREAILRRLRGEEISVDGPVVASGRIVSLERRTVEEGRSELFVTLFGDGGLTDISLEDAEHIAFSDPALNEEFSQLLEVLRYSRIDQERVLRLQLGSGYSGPVSVSYLHAVPVWKTSYRLVLGDGGEYRLQAWGHVDNTTAIPWRDATITLVSSRPVAFYMDLLTPLYVDRPRLSPPQATTVAPQTFERSLRRLAEAEEAPMAPEPMASALAFDDEGRGRPAPGATGATSSAVPTAVRYEIVADVNLAPGLGAMLPILDVLLPGRRVSLYRSQDGVTPRAGVEITNETGLALLAGPISVLEGNSYVGDSLTSDLAAGETSILTYALDTDTTVLTETQSDPETVSSLRVSDGVLVATRIRTLRTVYRYEHHGERLGTLIIEHPKRSGWEIVGGASPVSESESFLRFETPLTGVAGRMEIVEEQPVSSTVSLERLAPDQIAFYLTRPVIDPETAELLRRLRDIRSALTEVERSLESANREIDAVFRDQQRIRNNLERVPEDSDLARRYIDTLQAQEDELERLRERVTSLEADKAELERDLARLIEG